MSSLYLRGNSVWISFSDRFRIRRQLPTKFKLDKIERRGDRIIYPKSVLAWKKKFDERLALGMWKMDGSRSQPLKLSELRDAFMEGYGKNRSKATQDLYRYTMKRLIEHFGDIPAAAITEEDILRWRDRVRTKAGDQNVAKYVRTLAPIFKWAAVKGHIDANPFTQYTRLNPTPPPIKIYSDHELKLILEAAPAPLRDQLRFFLLTGFRLDEGIKLKWSAVDFREKVIHLENKKANRMDVFPMDRELETWMKKLPRDYEPYVFKYRGKWTVSTKLRLLIRKLNEEEKAGIDPELNVHTLRRNFISRLVKSRLSQIEVMYLARHRSIATTLKYYTAFDQGQMRRALEKSRDRQR
ncbi:MAG: tyrosine-type recombinase/integrase [Bacteroidota bacterium]